MPTLHQVFMSFIEHAPLTQSAPEQSFHEVTLLRRWWRKIGASSLPLDAYMRRDVGLPPLDDRGRPR